MQALKIAGLCIAFFALVRYGGVYYHTNEFERSVREEVRRAHSKTSLKEVILKKASEHKLPVTEESITITNANAAHRLDVQYRVPVDYILFKHDLAFSTVATDLKLKDKK